MYRGAQQEFQTGRLIPACVCTVVGQWFIHPRGSVVQNLLPNATFPIGKIFMGYVFSAPDGSVCATVPTGPGPASTQSTFQYDLGPAHPRMTPRKRASLSFWVHKRKGRDLL